MFQFSSIDLCTATTKPKFTQYSTTQLQMTVSLLILDQFRQSWAHFKALTMLYKWLPLNIIFSIIPNLHNTVPPNLKYTTIQYHSQIQMAVSLLILVWFTQSWAHFKALNKLYKKNHIKLNLYFYKHNFINSVSYEISYLKVVICRAY